MRSGAERGPLLVAALYLAAALHGLGAADIVGDDEAREAGIVQDVVAGHWLWPEFNAELLPDKPLLYHWAAAIPCAAAGFSETAVRLPSALAGAALVAWTGWFGGALLGGRAGVVAAALLATMPALFDHARVARPDVLLVLLLSIALGFAFRWWHERRRRDATLALVFLGLGTLAKGPVAVALFAFTVGAFLAWQADLGRLRGFVTAPGIVAFVVLGLGWYVVALAGWGERFVHEHLLGRYVRNLAGGLATGGPYSRKPLLYHLTFYPLHLPAVALPWTPLVALALWHAWRRRGFADPRLRFFLCWALAPVAVFTPAEWKLRYYLLPALPALALLAAPVTVELLAARPGVPHLRRAAVAALAALVVVAGVIVLVHGRWRPMSASDRRTTMALVAAVPGGVEGLAVAAGGALGVVAIAVAWRAWALLVGFTAVAVGAWMVLGAPALERAVSRRDSLKTFAGAVAARHPPPDRIVFYGETIRPIAVYLGRPAPPVDAVPADAAVIATGDAASRLARAGTPALPVLVAEGRIGNLSRGTVVLLENPAVER